MTRQFFTWTILLTSIIAHGQITLSDFDNLYTNFQEKKKEVKANKIKLLKVYSYKNDNSKKGKLVLQENYDMNGNITSKTDHHYIRYKDVEEISYSYDSLARIQKIISKTSFSRGWITYTSLTYDKDKVKFIVTDFGSPTELKFDTFYYAYYPDGKIKSRTERRYSNAYHNYYPLKPLYYHYNNFGDAYLDSKERDTIFDFKIRDKNGCEIGYTDTTYSKFKMWRDSLCNLLQFTEETFIDNKWVVIGQGKIKYDNKNRIIEDKYYYCRRQIFSRCTGKLKLLNHFKYEYNNNGLPIKEISYNERGQIIEVKKYVYEFYPN